MHSLLARQLKKAGLSDLDSGPAREAWLALNFTLYSIDERGRPRDLNRHGVPGGWQEDAHTDVIHNYVDALRAYPAWGGKAAFNTADKATHA